MNRTTKFFGKNKNCPTTNKLLLFATTELTAVEAARVSWHCANCEFCAAELSLLAAHPPTLEDRFETPPKISEIPAQLRQLAEVLLGSRAAGFIALKRLLTEKESFAHENVWITSKFNYQI